MPQPGYYSKYFYCLFCRVEIKRGDVVEAKGSRASGRFRNVRKIYYYCPTCGGNISSGTKARTDYDHVEGATRIRHH